jgi:hypothetical protein
MGGGAWPFLVRGLIRLVDSDNERDQNVWLVSGLRFPFPGGLSAAASAGRLRVSRFGASWGSASCGDYDTGNEVRAQSCGLPAL